MPARLHPLVLATHNAGKLREFSDLLAPLGYAIRSAGELGLEEPEETGLTFAENALLKARHAALATGMTALADDSGLAVPGLDGAPGIYSARWAGPEKDFQAAMRRVWEGLDQRGVAESQRKGSFVCVLALVTPQGAEHVFPGEVEGRLVWPPRGEGGFGYDPMFVPEGDTRSFAEMTKEAKHAISHRARAVAGLLAHLRLRAA